MRLVNMTKGPIDNGHKGKAAARVNPGEIGDFDESNKSVAKWISLRMLISEGEVLASRASALSNAPSLGEVLTLKAEVERREVIIADLRSRDEARSAEVKRMEEQFSALTAKNIELAAKAGEVETLKARVAELEALIATATTPAEKPATSRSRRDG